MHNSVEHMPVYRFFTILLFIAAFTCLLMCPAAHALCDGYIDYSNFLNSSDSTEIKKKILKEADPLSFMAAATDGTRDYYTFFDPESALHTKNSFTSPLIIAWLATIRLTL